MVKEKESSKKEEAPKVGENKQEVKSEKPVEKVENKKKEEVKKQESTKISIRSWLTLKGMNGFEWPPREIYAKKHGVEEATLEEWDELFKNY